MKAKIDELYVARKERRAHPDGKFDNAGRWEPSESEKCECCRGIRSPSRAYPYSMVAHCRSRKHVANLLRARGDI
jgi:hypothetical protein